MNKISIYCLTLLFAIFLPISNVDAQALSQCPSNLAPDLQLLNPACWTSVYVSSGYWQSCSWSNSGAICDNVTSSGAWAGSVFSAGSCSECPSSYYNTCHGNYYTNSCTGATHCDNAGPLPSAGGGWVDTSYYNNNCYYTKPVSWGAPAADGLMLATDVDTFSIPNTLVCQNESNSKYVDAEPTLKVNGLDSDTVDKFSPITLSWSSNYATSCRVPATSSTVGGWTGDKGIIGIGEPKDISSAPMPANSTAPATVLNYQISCTNPGVPTKYVPDTVLVTVTCNYLDSGWGDCNKKCGSGKQYRTVRYANCYEEVTERDCNNGDCPVSSEWKEVQP